MRARSPRTLILICVLGALACARASEAQNTGKMQKRAIGKKGSSGGGAHVELTAFNGIQLPKDLYASNGAAIGLAIPSTRYEDELMGDTRDQLMQKAQETANTYIDKARRIATEAGHKIDNEVKTLAG